MTYCYYLFERGEKEQDYPLKWDEIPAVEYASLDYKYSMENLIKQSNKRVKKDEVFTVIENTAIRLKNRQDSTYIYIYTVI